MPEIEEISTDGIISPLLVTDGERLFQIKLLGVKMDRLRREQDRAMRKVILDLDRLLQRPTITPDAAQKAISTKMRVLELLHKNTSGISNDIRRETALEVKRLQVLSKDKVTAVRAMNAVRKATTGTIDVTQLPPPTPPKVKMPPASHKFRATFGRPETASKNTGPVELS